MKPEIKNPYEEIAREKRRWSKGVEGRDVRGATTSCGFDVDLLYTPADLAHQDYLKDSGFPGEYPFTRGIHPTMYRESLWTMRTYSGFGTAEDTNARWQVLLREGLTGLSVAFDLPTQLGLDSDDPDVEADVGRVGVAVSTLADMERLFEGIPLDQISTNFTINNTSAPILAMYIAVAEKQGVGPKALRGTLQNDPLKEFAARGTWIWPLEPSLRMTADVIEYCARHVPRFNSISVSSQHMSEAGANMAEAVAYSFANALAYIDRVLARGLDIDQFAPRLSFNLGTCSPRFFETVAKFRAARRLWARLIGERYGAKDPRSLMLRCYSGSGGSTLTAVEPLNNVVRVAYELMAIVLGGAQAIHSGTYDEAYAIPTEQAQRLALRTQQILAYETGVTDTVDPLGGSYFVESLTERMEREIESTLEQIEREWGGIVSAIQSGDLQARILRRAYETERRIEGGEQVVVGINKFQEDVRREEIETFHPDPESTRRQVQRLKKLKAERDQARVDRCLGELRCAASGSANTVPFVLEAVKAYASIGEITGVLREVWGEFQEPVGI